MGQSEETVGLYDIRCLDGFYDSATTIIAERLTLQTAVREEGEMCATVALLDQMLALLQLHESQLGMCHHLHQVGVTHALKEREA